MVLVPVNVVVDHVLVTSVDVDDVVMDDEVRLVLVSVDDVVLGQPRSNRWQHQMVFKSDQACSHML